MKIVEWKVIGTSEKFTVLGFGEDGKMYYFTDGEWKPL